jgi:translation initiation factor IF-2
MHPEDRNKHAIDFGKDGREDRGGGRGRNRNRRRDNDNRDRNTDGRRRDFDGRDRGNDNRDRNNDGRRKDFDSRDRGTDNRRRDNDNRRLSAPKSEDFGSVPTAERKFRDKPRADKVKSANTPNRGSKKPSSRGKFSNGSGKKFATGGRKGR